MKEETAQTQVNNENEALDEAYLRKFGWEKLEERCSTTWVHEKYTYTVGYGFARQSRSAEDLETKSSKELTVQRKFTTQEAKKCQKQNSSEI